MGGFSSVVIEQLYRGQRGEMLFSYYSEELRFIGFFSNCHIS